MTKQVAKSTPSGRSNTAPSLAIARQIASNDSASAASAATYRFECRCRDQVVHDAVAAQAKELQELRGPEPREPR